MVHGLAPRAPARVETPIFVLDVLDVVLGRSRRDRQKCRDLAVRQAATYETEDLDLTVGQAGRSRGPNT
jgi:hypothetical protein